MYTTIQKFEVSEIYILKESFMLLKVALMNTNIQ